MLARNAKKSADADALKCTFTRHLASIDQRLADRNGFKTKFLWYADVIDQPERAAEEIVAFLDRDLLTSEMAASVHKNLYRNKRPDPQKRAPDVQRG